METLRQDLRSALRTVRRTPGVAAVIILSVALGIGACTTLLCLVWALVLRPLPFRDPGRLVAIAALPPGQSADSDPVWWTRMSWLDYRDVRAQSRSFSAVEAYFDNYGWTLSGGEPERVKGALVSGGMLSLLGARPFLGRLILPQDDRWEAESVVLLGYDLWQRRFGGDPGIVGKVIPANGSHYRVLGVMPPGFAFPSGNEAWISLETETPPAQNREVRRILVMARLRPGVTAAAAHRDLEAVSRRVAAAAPGNAGWSFLPVGVRRWLLGGDLQRSVLAVSAAVVSVLLIACANISSLLLAQGLKRRREMALRSALGAGPRRIVRQLLTESLFLAVTGSALGLPLGVAGLRLLRNALPELPYGFALTPDLPALAAAFGAAVAAGLLFGIAPALRAARPDLSAAFRQAAPGAGQGTGRLYAALIVSEVALAAVLLIAASLSLRTLAALRAEGTATAPGRLLTAWISFSGAHYVEREERARRLLAVVDRIAAVPGVEAAAGANFVPLSIINGGQAVVDVPGGVEGVTAMCNTVTSGFFRTWQTRWVAGRDLSAAETVTRSPVAVINETLARRLWPDGKAVGRRIHLRGTFAAGWVTVIGVAGDFKISSLREEPGAQVFVGAAYNAFRPAAVVLRTGLPPDRALAAVQQATRGVDPDLPLFTVATMEEIGDAHLRADRLSGGGLALFGGIALLFAAVGTYAVLAVRVTRRRREIAVHLALGAPRARLFRRLVARGIALTLVGLSLGLLTAAVASRALAGKLYGVTPTDPLSFGGVFILLLDVAFAACYLPARRALEIEPAEALRAE
jgi:putative ABC transport system permease protein